ncbi:DUF6624 domain-containing protein [Roseisolibacter sp. H3M3-2]|uniref:DUF6624 domain-containing protein n=1 Tax=Roseisolibacter sp. H3M3-2 TaxID=3031323 RepID=UPI0023DB94E2|nr:DUF6624 domain-containing protein [Roseisolibacter sp. H3M3-2]MDF1504673.1 hypothetical protein [Roseisolibacter sp. H3M3-2]
MLAALRDELLAMRAEDLRVRAELEATGELFQGYAPAMEAVHRRNAARLRALVAEHGWPGRSLAGDDGAEAAWLVAQHAIGEPAFLRDALAALREAAARGEVPAWQPAMLDDRIRLYEGRPQRWGTQFVPDPDGWLRPHDIEEPDGVEARRAAVGLPPLAPLLARPERQEIDDRAAFDREYRDWLRRTGWRA